MHLVKRSQEVLGSMAVRGQDALHMDQLDDLGARVRAARSYANLSQTELGEALGVGRLVVAAIEANDDRHDLTVPEARMITEATGVPLTFILQGWGAPPELVERVEVLEEEARRGRRERDALWRAVADLQRLVQDRLGIFVEEGLAQSQALADGAAHTREEGPRTP